MLRRCCLTHAISRTMVGPCYTQLSLVPRDAQIKAWASSHLSALTGEFAPLKGQIEHLAGDGFHLTERINRMVSSKSFHPQPHQLNFTIPCYRSS